jgi:hypothetical protein
MRIRQLKPTYYLDKTLWTKATSATREFYQGLWLVADDAGWFEWDVSTIAADIYRFGGVAKRERDANAHARVLLELQPDDPHLVIHPCGHAEVPKMPQHQRITEAKKVRTDYDRHLAGRCPAHPRGKPRDATDSLPGKERVRKGNGTEQVARALTRDEDGLSPAQAAALATGGFVAIRPVPKPSQRKSA